MLSKKLQRVATMLVLACLVSVGVSACLLVPVPVPWGHEHHGGRGHHR
jgi:hypothetical protein